MKKTICFVFSILFASFIYAKSNELSYEQLFEENQLLNEKIELLQEENVQLKNLIYKEAVVTINGKEVKTGGLLKGLSLAYVKWNAIKEKMLQNGNYVEIAGDDIFKYRIEYPDDLNVKLEKFEKAKNSNVNNDILKPERVSNKIIFAILFIGQMFILIALIIGIIIITSVIKRECGDNYNKIEDCNSNISNKIKELNHDFQLNLDKKIIRFNNIFDQLGVDYSDIKKRLEFYESYFTSYIKLFGKDLASIIDNTKSLNINTDEEKALADLLNSNFEQFDELSVRTRNALRKNNIRTIGELINFKESELTPSNGYYFFGKKVVQELKNFLSTYNLSFKSEIKILV